MLKVRLNVLHAVQVVVHPPMAVWYAHRVRLVDTLVPRILVWNVRPATFLPLQTVPLVHNVVPVTKVNSVAMAPARVCFVIRENFNPNPVHANSVQSARIPTTKE